MAKILTNRRLQTLFGAVIVLVLVSVVGSIGFASVIRSSSKETNSFLRSSLSSKMFSSDGSILADLHGEIDRDPVKLAAIPESMQSAVIAIEDRRFYDHGGIDLVGTTRALLKNLRGDRQGGSSISQQLAKNLYSYGESRTLIHKASEAVLTLGLEAVSTKDQILEAYLNTAYFGRGVYGVQTAARSYFRKDVADLTLGESAYLAGLIHMPGRYDYTTSDVEDEQRDRKKAALARRNVVLGAMADVGSISAALARTKSAQPIDISPPRDSRWQHPYFVDAVLRELGVLRNRGESTPDDRFDFLGDTHSERAQAVYRKGLRIHTSLEPRAQHNAEKALAAQLPSGVFPKLSAALVSVEPDTGLVRALIGGRDYYPKGCEENDGATARPVCRHAKVNLALGSASGGSGRQPGSSFKPVVLAAALEDGLSLRQTLNGSAFTYKYGKDDNGAPGQVWKVQNYEGSAGGEMSVVDATVRSVNAAYARLEVQFLGDGDGLKGAAKVAALARKLGISFPTTRDLEASCGTSYLKHGGCTPADMVPAIALGAKEVAPIEMAGAYATFANEGVYAKPTFIEKITDATGKVVYRAKPQRHRAVSRNTALGVSHVLQQAVSRGTGRAAALPDRPVAGKTGTSQAWRDAWFDGYVPQLMTVVWVGNPVPVQARDGSWAVESMTPSNGYGIKVTGGSYPARIWNAYMGPALSKTRVDSFPAAPGVLFGPSQKLKPIDGESPEVSEVSEVSDLAALIRLERAGHRVVVHRECPPGGSRGINVWKTEKRGDTTHVYRSRAVC